MAKQIEIKTVKQYKSGTGVVYLIEDAGTVRKADVWLDAGVDPAVYGAGNVNALFAAGVDADEREFDALAEKNLATVHEDALFGAIKALRGGGTLDDMNAAMEAVYTADGKRDDLITDFVQEYARGTDAQRYRFNAILLFALGALVRK